MIEFRNGYSIDWAVGAGMVLFHRNAARLIVDHYAELEYTLGQMKDFYSMGLGVSLDKAEVYRRGYSLDHAFTFDWGYAPLLYQHGLATVGAVPSYAYDLEFDVRPWLGTRYVQHSDNATGLVTPLIEV